MCLTAHFIDDDWKLQKRILNFCLVGDHKGETIGRKIESLLLDWNIEGIFTLTVDNASSNDTILKFLMKRTKEWKGTILGHEHLHMRCCAHILNLIVVEGLKEENRSIDRVRDVVRYVRSSPQRLESFKTCVEKEKIDCSQTVCLDVSTRWNSTYLMLEVAVKFEKAFQRMADKDTNFKKYFNIKVVEDWEDEDASRVPTKLDWKNCKLFVTFLKLFYDATKRFSGSLFVTSNSVFDEILKIEATLEKLLDNKDPLMCAMAARMKEKFLRYWGDGGKINVNIYIYVAVALDPRLKLRWLRFRYTKSKGKDVGINMESRVKAVLVRLYDAYASDSQSRIQVRSASETPSVRVEEDCDYQSSLHSEFDTYLEEEYSSVYESELDKYLVAPCERSTNATFDILVWWKNNSNKYPILSQIARDVLAIPVSTVASESAFSTGGRILDPFRSSLLPSMVETLICTQNWLLHTVPINLRQAMDKVEDLEREILQPDDTSSEVRSNRSDGIRID
ncbi:AC transposase [Actinidia chinensis var. chinensis]|uniref:AC transposase n=1 Tax=Actinidia chinensis var. chinensis TaxID=1590841 RepID=A0A2R6RFY7_ACTCC|nr:AC transposase [Actinidia chinensis var. chinensis]